MLPTLNRVLSYIVFVRTPRSTALTEQEIHCQTESPGVAVATFVKELPRYLQKTLDVTKLHTLAVGNGSGWGASRGVRPPATEASSLSMWLDGFLRSESATSATPRPVRIVSVAPAQPNSRRESTVLYIMYNMLLADGARAA